MFFAASAPAHDIHLSKCDVEYNKEEKAVQVSLRVFIDDFELALTEKGASNLFLCTKKEHPEAQNYMEAYLRENFKIETDDKQLSFDFIGKEISEDLAAVWCYLEIPNVEFERNFTVINKVFMELYADQRNIVKVKLDKNTKEHFLFDPSDYTGKIDL
jgi:hypothetical protein